MTNLIPSYIEIKSIYIELWFILFKENQETLSRLREKQLSLWSWEEISNYINKNEENVRQSVYRWGAIKTG